MSVALYYGDDRLRAEAAIRRALGEYEVVEGEELAPGMLATVFFGTSLFEEVRKIVVKDLSLNAAAWEKVGEYLATAHQVILWESRVDKRTAAYKALVAAGVEVKEFKLPEKVDPRRVFDIYNTALRDGKRAVALLAEVKAEEDPYKMVGLFTTQALRDFTGRPREKRIVKELAKLDLDMKSSTVEAWQLVESFLIRLSSF